MGIRQKLEGLLGDLPVTISHDPDGRIRYTVTGAMTPDQVAELNMVSIQNPWSGEAFIETPARADLTTGDLHKALAADGHAIRGIDTRDEEYLEGLWFVRLQGSPTPEEVRACAVACKVLGKLARTRVEVKKDLEKALVLQSALSQEPVIMDQELADVARVIASLKAELAQG